MNSWILTILTVSGVWGGAWKVTFENQCALRGSTVLIKCKYDYPFGHIVTSVQWSKAVSGSDSRRQLFSNQYSASSNYQYRGDTSSNCDLEISNVQPDDEGSYWFTFQTTLDGWTSKTSARLSVRELNAVVTPGTVTEGDHVRLTCESGCPSPPPVVWFRDGQPVPSAVFWARRGDAGRYHCSNFRQETVRSEPVALSVRYAPDTVRLSLSGPGGVTQGRRVLLFCSCDSYPPVPYNGYRLYKDGQFIGEGSYHIIAAIQPSHSGLYLCQAWNNVSRRGSDRFNSPPVRLDVQYRPMNISVLVTPPDMAEGGSVKVICSSAANPAAHSYTWYKRTASPSPSSLVQVGTGPVLSLPSVEGPHAGLYLCRAKNSLGESNSTEVLLTMKKEQPGTLVLTVSAAVGVSLVGMLLIALVWFWRKRRSSATTKKTSFAIVLSERDSCPPHAEDPPDSIYANVHMPPSAPPLDSISLRNSHHNALPSHEDEVTYSTVTVKPQPVNSRAAKDSWSETDGNDLSVVYASVVRSS